MLTIKGKQVRIQERPVAQCAFPEIELCGQAQVERDNWIRDLVSTCFRYI